MGNYCSIFHTNYEKLLSVTNNHNKAVFLDKCLYWWQISTYTLGDNKIWFTRTLPAIAKETSISERSISRYLEQFEEQGLIERICKLSASNKNANFSVTKKLYIRVTEKLLNLLQLKAPQEPSPMPNQESSFSNQHGDIDIANLATSLYKDKEYNKNNNNTVSQVSIVNNLQKPQDQNQTTPTQPDTSKAYPIEPLIGERITEQLKNYIKGMLFNLHKQHQVKLSDPNKVFAEVVFSVTQTPQWQGIDCPHHRVNIIAKLLRLNLWKTPKGFYNHWDVGQWFRQKQQQDFKSIQSQKVKESLDENKFFSGAVLDKEPHPRFEPGFNLEYAYSKPKQYELEAQRQKQKGLLLDIITDLGCQESYLKQLETWQKQNNPVVTKDLMDSVAMKVARLYQEKQRLEEGLKDNIAIAA